MKTRSTILVLLFCIIVAGVAALVFIPVPVAKAPTMATSTSPGSLEDLIVVSSPLPGALITSPLSVSGRARGTWYFEASAPVKLLDGNGKLLAQAPIQAQSDWMTTEYIPFTSILSFSLPQTATGTLIFMNDNPSGDPSRQKELRIPVRFH